MRHLSPPPRSLMALGRRGDGATALRCATVAAIVTLFAAGPALARQPVDVSVQGPDPSEAISASEDGTYVFTVQPRVLTPHAPQWDVEVNGTVGWSVELADPSGDPLGEAGVTVSAEPGDPTAPIFVRAVPPTEVGHPDAGYLTVDLHFDDPSGHRHEQVHFLHFEVEDSGALVASSGAKALEERTRVADGTRFLVGGDVDLPVDPELRHVAPWDNPQLPPELQEFAAERMGESPTETAGGALSTNEAPAAGDAGAEVSGCAATTGGDTLPLTLGLGGLALLVGVVRRRRHVVVISGVIVLAVTVVAPASQADELTAYGYVTFWDTRSSLGDTLGERNPSCDTGDTTCSPADGFDCCFRGIPRVTVSLHEYQFPGVGPAIDTMETTWSGTHYDGFYLLTDPDGTPGTWYTLVVTYYRDGFPARFEIVTEDGSEQWAHELSPFVLDEELTFMHKSVNTAGDTNSLFGNLASIWTSADETFQIFEDEDETRHRSAYGSPNAYDLIQARYLGQPNPGGTTSQCHVDRININPSHSRTTVVAHELGHQLHGRVVGCAGNAPAFPTYRGPAGSWTTSESNALGETTSELVGALWRWDPATTETPDFFAGGSQCTATADNYDNINHVSANRNNVNVLWEFLDAHDGNTDPQYSYDDTVEITLSDLFDGLVALQETPGSQGQNRTADERYESQVPGIMCNGDPDVCDPGDACYGSSCWTGDPHGCNIRDWIHHLAGEVSATETDLWQTMVSSPCVGAADNTWPFTGGYRTN